MVILLRLLPDLDGFLWHACRSSCKSVRYDILALED